MQLGFVIDHTRCIGCHACTVACKAENDVPVGSFRTWVKYTEQGEFPSVKRSFAVLRCNQCTAAPCVTICPTSALQKRADGIVDVNPDLCIGCKSCMQGCPYDALYIGGSGTAEKCHFCAHRTELGLAPACAVVCPTEAIIPGDFDDPNSRVSRMKSELGLAARKTEAETGPNVFYREADPAGLEPLQTNAAGGYLWSNRVADDELEAEEFRAAHEQSLARTTYDVEHERWWGRRVSAYLVTKAISAGAVLATLPAMISGRSDALAMWVAGVALVFLLATTVLLILDLKRPERFLLILTHPNWDSWLVRGTVFLMAYGGLLSLWLLLGALAALPTGALRAALALATALCAAGTAGYTGALFAQCKGRVLWMQRHLWLALIVRSVAAGGALMLLLRPFVEALQGFAALHWITAAAASLAGLFTLLGSRLAPRRREEEYRQVHRLLSHGPFHGLHGASIGLTGIAAIALVTTAAGLGQWFNALGGLLFLIALWAHEEGTVKAGQALPIS